MTVTLTLKTKADRLLAEGNVSHVRGHFYRVHGDHGVYWVLVSYAQGGSGSCTCPRYQNSQETCSHLFAACVYELANPVPEPLWKADPFEGLT